MTLKSSLKLLNCETVLASLQGSVSESYDCSVEGSFLVVLTPLLYADGDSIRVYIDLTTLLQDVTITDLSDGINRAKAYGLDVPAPRLREIVSALEVSVTTNKILSRRVPLSNVGSGILAVAQAAAMAEAAAVDRPVAAKGLFQQQIDRFFVDRHVPVRRDFFYSVKIPENGVTSRVVRKKVDYVVADTALLVTVPKNRQTLRHAEHAYAVWSLMDRADDSSPRLTVVDEALKNDDDVELLESLSSVVTLQQLKETKGDPEAIIGLGARSLRRWPSPTQLKSK